MVLHPNWEFSSSTQDKVLLIFSVFSFPSAHIFNVVNSSCTSRSRRRTRGCFWIRIRSTFDFMQLTEKNFTHIEIRLGRALSLHLSKSVTSPESGKQELKPDREQTQNLVPDEFRLIIGFLNLSNNKYVHSLHTEPLVQGPSGLSGPWPVLADPFSQLVSVSILCCLCSFLTF